MAKSLLQPKPGTMVPWDRDEEGIVGDVVLSEVIESSMLIYADKTIEDRAIPDYRDGFIPLYRRLLWSMYRSKMWPTDSTRKSAKVVGDTMGSYHPHGDAAIYGGLVTLANYRYSLIHKQGNWGNLVDPPAAMRYTECRLSPFALGAVLDPYTMPVLEELPTYDGKDVEPLLFVPNLPLALLYGTVAGIAVGVTCCIPAFTAESLHALLVAAMKKSLAAGKAVPISAEDCADTLEFYYHTGGHVTATREELVAFFSSEAGSIGWECDYEWSDKRHAAVVRGFPPNWNPSNMLDRFRNLDEVKQVSIGNDGASNIAERKLEMEIILKAGTASEVQAAWDKVVKMLSCTVHYKCNFTKRYLVGTEPGEIRSTRAQFFKASVPRMLDAWIAWRVRQHRAALAHEQTTLVAQRAREDLIKRTLDVLDQLYEMLKRTRREPKFDNVAALAKLLSITTEESKQMWDIPIGRFRKLDVDAQQAKIDRIDARLAQVKSDLGRVYLATARWLHKHSMV